MTKYKKIIPFIFGLTIVSFLSLVVLLYIWLKDAIIIQEYQYKQEINEVTEDFNQQLIYYLADYKKINVKNVDANNPNIHQQLFPSLDNIPTVQITQLINNALKKHRIESNFEFVIYHGSVPIHKSENLNTQLSNHAHYKSLDYHEQYVLYLYVDKKTSTLLSKNIGIIVFISLCIALILFIFYLSLKTLHHQKRVTDVTNDFINNMTHEFKTPISVINLASSTLANPKVHANYDSMKLYLDIIKEECNKMNHQVQRILEIAQQDGGKVKIDTAPIDISLLLRDLSQNYQLQLAEIGGTLNRDFIAHKATISGDKVHITNVMNTLFDNAYKYRKQHEPVKLHIITNNINNQLHITFSDNGMGMSKEQVKHAFKKFYRASAGNLHNIKGFGLGLTYVKNVIDAHQGKINITSAISKGTNVTIILNLH